MRYALKRVRKKQDGRVPSEVSRECRLLAENDHPMVMHLVKTFETAGSVYMLTELITGGELHAAIRRIPTVLSRAQAQFYAGCLVLVLEALADRNIVFRDLKPENVMLDSQGYLKLVDFGISKKLSEGKFYTFTVIGTPHYMAPEILTGKGYGVEVDIWSLGVILFEFVCGFLPFADDLDDPTGICQAVLRSRLKFPSRFRDVEGRACIEGLLCRQPKKRLGCGISGYEALKAAPYFMAGHEPGKDSTSGESSLFSKLMSRELEPPLVPETETYSEELDGASLSDANELG
jgi:cGMP-dependent protein kinase